MANPDGGLATPLLQALFFDEAVSLVLNPDKNLMFFLSDANGDILNLFIIVVILLVTIRIPRYVSRHIGQSSGMSPPGWSCGPWSPRPSPAASPDCPAPCADTGRH